MARLIGILHSARAWVVLAVLAPVGMLALSGSMLLDLRREAWVRADQTSQNLLQLIERDVERNIEIIDLSLRSVVSNLRAPGVDQASPELRQLVLFDPAANARDIGVMLVLDENGDTILDSAGYPARKLNNADRDYFKAQKADPNLGLNISKPLVSRLTGERIVVLSRRIDKPDGSFGGLVLASLRLTYFQRLFNRVGLGSEGAVNLYLRDGTRIMRFPYVDADIGASIAGSANFEHFIGQSSGTFVATSVRDGIERLYTFAQVGSLPLVLNVALATRDIEAVWRGKAIAIGAVLAVLCAVTAGLALLFGQQLRRRGEMQAEMARLARTDVLTGLPNRRHFDQEFERAFEASERRDEPFSLLLVDADHFKRFNDRFGHTVGDDVLRGLARCLERALPSPGDLVARIGGEEFAVILYGADQSGAGRVAIRIHEEASRLSIDAAGIAAGAVTVSIGAASPIGFETPRSLYSRADAALYAAKSGGRNQTRTSPAAGPPAASLAAVAARPGAVKLVHLG